MITRLIAIAIAGITLTGHAPRWLATSDQAWIIWITAAAFVFMGLRLLRYAIKSVAGRVHAFSLRRPAASVVQRTALKPAP